MAPATNYIQINNTTLNRYVAWTFRKAAKFFDIVTYTGDDVGGRQVLSGLVSTVGMAIIKRTSDTGNWMVVHRSLTSGYYQYLNTTDLANAGAGISIVSGGIQFAASSSFNSLGDSYVAYLFAHDTSANGVIQCGSFTTDGSGNATVNLGWEPQWLTLKASSVAGNWFTVDVMRGFGASVANVLFPNLSNAEDTSWTPPSVGTAVTSTGFTAGNLGASRTFIYLAIRRPNKPPTLGTQIFSSASYTGNDAIRILNTTIVADLVLAGCRSSSVGAYSTFHDRLRGAQKKLEIFSSAIEATVSDGIIDFGYNDAIKLGASNGLYNDSRYTYVLNVFKRAPGVFDIVCYTGTSANLSLSHNLAVTPELLIIKKRNAVNEWYVMHSFTGTGYNRSYLEQTAAATSHLYADNFIFTSSPTITQIFLTGNANVNSSNTFVAYLFATKAGISKVGSYTGNGSSQTINCGFTTGARFILIKQTNSGGDWYIWDSERGIVAGNDPHLSLNTTAAEVTSDDSIDSDNSGFIVNQVGSSDVNLNSATYIFLAMA